MKKTLIAALAFGFGLLILLGLYQRLSENPIARNHVFTTLTGESVAWSDFRGKPLLVTFWATDCQSCLKEIPHLIDLYQKYHARGLEIIAVAMYYDPPSHVVNMAQTMRLPYPVVLDLSGNHAKSFGNVALTPTTFLIDAEGKVRFKVTGLFDENDLSKRIHALLKG